MNETAHPRTAPLRARAEIDLAALRANVRALRERTPGAALMAVVKSDAYG
ncbi:alanine racemase, partial [Streptomyces sp. SID8499]